MEGYDDDGKPKIPGTLNKGIGGEHGIVNSIQQELYKIEKIKIQHP